MFIFTLENDIILIMVNKINFEVNKMKFQSTRGSEKGVASAEAIIKGIAKDGGLFVPDGTIPDLYKTLKKEKGLTYEELAFKIIKEYFTDIKQTELMDAINYIEKLKSGSQLAALLKNKTGSGIL